MSDIGTTVLAIQGNVVKKETLTSSQDGYVLTWDGTLSQWYGNSLPSPTPTGPAGGDLEGTYPNPSVKSISGYNIGSTIGTILPNDFTFASINTGVCEDEFYASPSLVSRSLQVSGATQGVITMVAQSPSGGSYENATKVDHDYSRTYIVLGNVGSATSTGLTAVQDLTNPNNHFTVLSGLNVSIGFDNTTALPATYTNLETANRVSLYAAEQIAFKNGGMNFSQINNQSSNYDLIISDFIVVGDTTSSAITFTLPALPNTGDTYVLKDGGGNASTNNLTINGNGSNIDGSSTYIISTNYGCITVVFNGTMWVCINKSL